MSFVQTFWERRSRLDTQPHLSNRTLKVISHVMNELNMSLAEALEYLICENNVYANALEEVSKTIKDIKPNEEWEYERR